MQNRGSQRTHQPNKEGHIMTSSQPTMDANKANGAHTSEEEQKRVLSEGYGNEKRDQIQMETVYNATAGPEELRDFLKRGFFAPTPGHIQKTIYQKPGSGLPEVLNKTAAIIPCFEPQKEKVSAVLKTAETLVSKLGPDRVIYIIAEVHPEAQEGLQELGVQMFSENDVRRRCDWPSLAKLINLYPDEPNQLQKVLRGKGVTVMFGLAALYVERPEIFNDLDWIVLCDAEIQRFDEYRVLEYLMYPAAAASMNGECHNFEQLVQAKIGRGNEGMCMALNMLHAMMHSQALPEKVREAAQFNYYALASHVWYGCGERALKASKVPHLAIGGGYTLEIIFDFGIPRRFNEEECIVGQTANPNPRLDGANSDEKEWLMWSQIGKTAHSLAANGIIIPELKTLEDYERANKVAMTNELGTMLMLPNNYESPVTSIASRFPRIYPPVRLLLENDIIKY